MPASISGSVTYALSSPAPPARARAPAAPSSSAAASSLVLALRGGRPPSSPASSSLPAPLNAPAPLSEPSPAPAKAPESDTSVRPSLPCRRALGPQMSSHGPAAGPQGGACGVEAHRAVEGLRALRHVDPRDEPANLRTKTQSRARQGGI
jgi:hypothetical protein